MQVWGRPCIAIAIDMYIDDVDDDDIFTFIDVPLMRSLCGHTRRSLVSPASVFG